MDLRTIINSSDAVSEPKKSRSQDSANPSSPHSATSTRPIQSHQESSEDARRVSESLRPPYIHHRDAAIPPTVAVPYPRDDARLSLAQPSAPPAQVHVQCQSQGQPQPQPQHPAAAAATAVVSPGTSGFVTAQSPYHRSSLPLTYNSASASAAGPQLSGQESYFQSYAHQPARQRAESLNARPNVPTAYVQSMTSQPAPNALRQATPPNLLPSSHTSHHQLSPSQTLNLPPPPSADREPLAPGIVPRRGSQQLSPQQLQQHPLQQHPLQQQQQQQQQQERQHQATSPHEQKRHSLVHETQQQIQQQHLPTAATGQWNLTDRRGHWDSRDLATKGALPGSSPQVYQPQKKMIHSAPSVHSVHSTSRHGSDGDIVMSPSARVGRGSFSSSGKDSASQRALYERTMEDQQPAPSHIHDRNGNFSTGTSSIDQGGTYTFYYGPSFPHYYQGYFAQHYLGPTDSQARPGTNHHPNNRGTTDTSARKFPSPSHSAEPPMKRRKRYSEIPIWARKAARRYGQPPAIPPPEHRTPYVPKRNSGHGNAADIPQSSRRPVSSGRPGGEPPHVPSHAYPDDDIPFQVEPTFTGVVPREELCDAVANFLYSHIVPRKEIGVSGLGEVVYGKRTVFEVEAKLGRFIDRDRQMRLQLPVSTETVFEKDYTGARLQFESHMTSAQHRCLNEFLNKATTESQPPNSARTRIPIGYVHRRQVDTFYEIPIERLPPLMHQFFDRRYGPRVRVTRDQETGEVVAKIVKCRVADLDVFSPNTPLDWRLSVNIEMNYEGDINELKPASESAAAGSKGDRIKDRMSYMHMFSQIDLTQVEDPNVPGPMGQAPRFVHELEIEISTAEVRRQGEKAFAGVRNQYYELIKSYVDNIRILSRTVPAFD
ncbi:mRNA-capping enzyme subunit beta [Ascosphaera aggregata]|nr:mRNA-capping enzyme subunit beta [Ascosphaera aggregata]